MLVFNKVRFSTEVVSGQRLVLDLAGNRVLALNDTGNQIWEALEDGATLDELSEILLKSGAPDEDAAQRDARAFVDQLLERGLFVQDEQE